MASNACCFNLGSIPMNVLTVLYDSNLIVDFLTQLENDKLEKLGRKKEVVPKIYQKVIMSSELL